MEQAINKNTIELEQSKSKKKFELKQNNKPPRNVACHVISKAFDLASSGKGIKILIKP